MDLLWEESCKENAIMADIEMHLNQMNITDQLPRCSTPDPDKLPSETPLDLSGYYKFYLGIVETPLKPKLRGNLRPKGFVGGFFLMPGAKRSKSDDIFKILLPTEIIKATSKKLFKISSGDVMCQVLKLKSKR